MLISVMGMAVVCSVSVRREYHDHAGEVSHTHGNEGHGRDAKAGKGNRGWVHRRRLREKIQPVHAGHSHFGHPHSGHSDAGHVHWGKSTELGEIDEGVGVHCHLSLFGWEFTVWDPTSRLFQTSSPETASSELKSVTPPVSRGVPRSESRSPFVCSPSLSFREGESGGWMMNCCLRRTRCPRPDDMPCAGMESEDDRIEFPSRKPPVPPPRAFSRV